MNKRVLLLGGTGAMGNHLADDLRKNGESVVVTTRSSRKSNDEIRYLQGNAHDIDFLKRIIKEEDYECIVDFMSYSTKEFRERRDLLLNATEQYVFLSSSRVYAESKTPLQETSARLLDCCTDKQYLKTDEYALAKARQENLLFESKTKNWTIIRPYITYSNIRLQLGVYEKEKWLYRALNGRPIVFSKDVASKSTSLTYGGDVARVMTKLIGNKKATGEAFHIVSPENIRWNDVLNIYVDALTEIRGTRPIVELTESAIVPEEAKYQYQYDRLFNRTFDSGKVEKVIGEVPTYIKPKEGLTRCVREFILEFESFQTIDWRMEAAFDRRTASRTSVSEIQGKRDRLRYLGYRYAPTIMNVIKSMV